jgi:hypothetical protein
MVTFVRRGWGGQERLSKVFWYALLAIIVLSVLYVLALRAADFTGLKVIRSVAVLTVFAAGMTWCVWTAVALWRCAPNVTGRIWSLVARICAIALAALVVYTFYELVV